LNQGLAQRKIDSDTFSEIFGNRPVAGRSGSKWFILLGSNRLALGRNRAAFERGMMKHKITLIPGDGIGPEVTAGTLKVIEAAGLDVEWETINAGADAFERHGKYLPDELLSSIQRTRVAIKGPISTPIGKGFSSINVALRKALTLYANFRPIKTLRGVKTRFDDVDIIVVRENTEDLYSGLEHVVVPGVVESLKIITAEASTRIARFAFEYA